MEAIVSAGINLEDSVRCLEIARVYDLIFPAVGLHPTEDLSEVDAVLNLIENSPDIVAVGEIGLDYKFARKPEQMEPFVKQIRIAKELDLPVVVHSRSAGRYVLDVLEAEGVEKALLHGFDGSRKLVKRIVERGYYVSVPTTVIRSESKQKLVEAVPLENLMLETDSPVCSPFEGRNEPANLLYGLKKVAEIKGVDPKELDKVTARNARELFKI